MATGKQNRDFEESVLNDVKLLDNAIEWIKKNMKPDQVFDDNQLETWAEDNGFEKVAP